MKRESGQLPVDFLVGFTIFILSLIMVANFVPSLLVGLQRTTGIDYDAVAYRTGVVLVEDPGEPAGIPIGRDPFEFSTTLDWRPWEFRDSKDQIARFGLALTRDTPNLLSINKINKFFCTTVFDDRFDSATNDYRSKLLFSSYQYGYNVTLKNISPMKPGDPGLDVSIGQPYPSGYGYIRRYVVIKQNPNATINMADPNTNSAFNARRDDQVCIIVPSRVPPLVDLTGCNQQFTIRLTGSVLYNESIGDPYKIDLQREPLVISITGLHTLLNNSDWDADPAYQYNPNWYQLANHTKGKIINTGGGEWNGTTPNAPTWATLKSVDFGQPGNFDLWSNFITNVQIANDSNPQPFPLNMNGLAVRDSLSLSMNYVDANYLGEGKDLDVTFSFNDPIPHTLIHGTYLYDYNRTNVTQPYLSTGMMEVGIW
jgi:hypothetical protein